MRKPFCEGHLTGDSELKVHISYFAALRDETRTEREELDLKEGSSITDLFQALIEVHPYIGGRDSLVFAVNGIRSGTDRILRQGDSVAVILPVSGG